MDLENDKLDDVEVGSIKSITLYNFMCHKYFEIEFGPRINFVIGKNGSGKSAILTAIVLVLGGRASNTSRGQTVKSFIKSGETKAKIIIKLCNYNGCDKTSSFNHDKFGDTIIVERILRYDGSSYFLKSAQGKTISSKKEDLDDIIRHFSIQIDNPVCVLNQEVSRNFLNSKNPKDKYNFFMKATQLEQIRNDYAAAQEKSKLTSHELVNKKAILNQVENELKDLKSKVDMLNKLANQGNNLIILRNEMKWAKVNEKEIEIGRFEKELADKVAKVESVQKNIEKLTHQFSELDEERSQNLKKLETINHKVEEIDQKKSEEATQIRVLKNKKMAFELDLNKFTKEFVSLERNENSLKEKINELKRQYGDEKQRQVEVEMRLQKIADLESEQEELKAALKTAHIHKERLQTSIASITDQIAETNEAVTSIKRSIETSKGHLVNLQKSRSNQLNRFGTYFPELVRCIEEEYKKGNFREKPLGPIGHMIKLKDASAGLAVECCLKNLIFAFCCDNSTDAKLFQQIMQKVIGNSAVYPLIITRKFKQRHNTEYHEVSNEKYPTMLDLLYIKEDPVANILIDRLSIESISYIADEQEALNVMTDPNQVPRNCMQAYTREGTNMYPRRDNQYFKSYSANVKQVRYLSRDIQTYIQELESEISQLSKEIVIKNQTIEPLRKVLSQNRTDMVNVEIKIKDLQKRITSIGSEVLDLKNVEEPTSIEISAFEEELESFVSKKSQLNEKIEKNKVSLDQLKNEMDELSKVLSSRDQERSNLLDQRHPLQVSVNSFSDKVNNSKRQLAKLEVVAQTLKSSHQELLKSISNLKAELEDVKSDAIKDHEKRISTKRSSNEIKREIEEIQVFLSEKEKEIGDRHTIMSQYQAKNEKLLETKNQVENISQYLTEFKQSMKVRFKEYNDLKNRITQRACNIFSLALETLNFSGSLHVYHENTTVDGVAKKEKTLEIKINPKVNSQSTTYNDTRSLSGGERSFSTVAFLLALWESCNSPFRILDEVDVFMDMVTRSTALQILIANAKLKTGKQYIFLSPLGLATFENSIRVHRMPDPLRTNSGSCALNQQS